MRGLQGKNVIVTGAASGIGRASAGRLVEEGANVFGADAVAAGGPPELSSPSPSAPSASALGTWAFQLVDVGDEESVQGLVRSAVDTLGRIDGLVNAAGVAGGGPVHLLDKTEWDRVLRVNLFGTFLTAKGSPID